MRNRCCLRCASPSPSTARRMPGNRMRSRPIEGTNREREIIPTQGADDRRRRAQRAESVEDQTNAGLDLGGPCGSRQRPTEHQPPSPVLGARANRGDSEEGDTWSELPPDPTTGSAAGAPRFLSDLSPDREVHSTHGRDEERSAAGRSAWHCPSQRLICPEPSG